PIGADRDHLETLGSTLEGPDNIRRDSHHVPRAELRDLVVETHSPRAADDDVCLLLFAVAVAAAGPVARSVAEVAHAEMLAVQVAAPKARLHVGPVSGQVIQLFEVRNREIGHSGKITSVADWDDVRRLALALPEATEEPLHGLVSWRVRGKLFVWERPLRQSDLRALGDAAPEGPILGARVEHLG